MPLAKHTLASMPGLREPVSAVAAAGLWLTEARPPESPLIGGIALDRNCGRIDDGTGSTSMRRSAATDARATGVSLQYGGTGLE